MTVVKRIVGCPTNLTTPGFFIVYTSRAIYTTYTIYYNPLSLNIITAYLSIAAQLMLVVTDVIMMPT